MYPKIQCLALPHFLHSIPLLLTKAKANLFGDFPLIFTGPRCCLFSFLFWWWWLLLIPTFSFHVLVIFLFALVVVVFTDSYFPSLLWLEN